MVWSVKILLKLLSVLPSADIYWTDVIDILIVAYLIYKTIKLVKETRAEQLIKGIVLLLILLQLSYTLRLNTINFIIRYSMQFGVIAILIVFQPELRRALEKIGTSKIGNIFVPDVRVNEETIAVVDSVVQACQSMSKDKVGALIVIERDTKLGEIIRTGVTLDADVCRELLINIFFPNTPLHDGAVIIRNSKITAAGCFLPLTSNSNLNKQLGTRHRAGIGMSENSDAVVVIVSEETGTISIALNGNLTRNLTGDTLKKALVKFLVKDDPSHKRRKFFRRRDKK